MVLADWIAIGIVVVFIALGALIGFGSGLKFFTSGIFGIIIGVVVCALVGTVFLEVGFVRDLLDKLAACWENVDFLVKIRLDVVIYYIILFIVVQLLRIIIVMIIKHVTQSKNVIIRIINRTLGAVLFLALGVLLAFLALKIIGWVGGDTAMNLYDSLTGSAFKLDVLFEKLNSKWAEENLQLAVLLNLI